MRGPGFNSFIALVLAVSLIAEPIAAAVQPMAVQPALVALSRPSLHNSTILRQQAMLLPHIWAMKAFLFSGGKRVREQGAGIARGTLSRPALVAGLAAVAATLFDLDVSALLFLGMVGDLKKLSTPGYNPWEVDNKVLLEVDDKPRKPKRVVATITGVSKQKITVEFGDGMTAELARDSVKPLIPLPILAILLDVSPYETLEPAVRNGWIKPDVASNSVPGSDTDYFLLENLAAYRDKFVLRYPLKDLIDIAELTKIVGKDPDRLYRMLEVGVLFPEPVQIIWTGDIRGTPYFLRSDIPKFIKRYAPLKWPNSYRINTLADELERPERVVARVIRRNIIELEIEIIGTPANPIYVVTPAQMKALRAMLAPQPQIKDPGPLRDHKSKVVKLGAVVKALKKSLTRVRELVNTREIEPFQVIWHTERNRTDYFLESDIPELQKDFSPELVPHAKGLKKLAKTLKSPYPTVEEALEDGLLIPEERIGYYSRPFYIVPPELMEKFRQILHPESNQVSFFEIAKTHHGEVEQIARIVHQLQLPVIVKGFGKRMHRYVDKKHEAAIVAELPLATPKNTISRTGVMMRYNVREHRFKGLSSDFPIVHGTRTHHYYYLNRLPKSKKKADVDAWLKKWSDKVDIFGKRSSAKRRNGFLHVGLAIGIAASAALAPLAGAGLPLAVSVFFASWAIFKSNTGIHLRRIDAAA